MAIRTWMSWEGGVDLAAMTKPGLAQPNVMVHVARMVHTPIGSAPSGMVLWQPDPAAPPALIGFVSSDEKLARWFGSNVFAGTPFEKAPALVGTIEISVAAEAVGARVTVGGMRFETRLSKLGTLALVHRAAGAHAPFATQGLEAGAAQATLSVDGKSVAITVPPSPPGLAPAALFAPSGLYAR